MMLEYSFGETEIAARIRDAVKKAVQDGIRTGDIAFGKTPVRYQNHGSGNHRTSVTRPAANT